MPRSYLNPKSPRSDPDSIVGDWSAPPRVNLPPALWDFGFVPDPSQLQPGDLLLFHSTKPDRVSGWIIDVQKQGHFEEKHARWHHAAVYVHDFYICEAELTGVCYRPLFSDINKDTEILVRRPDYDALAKAAEAIDGKEHSTDEIRLALLINAMHRLGTPYGYWKALKMWWQSSKGLWGYHLGYGHAKSVICSELYAEAYMKAADRTIVPNYTSVAFPAHLSKTTNLRDVPVNWLRLTESSYVVEGPER